MSWTRFDAVADGWLLHALQASWQVALLIAGVWLVLGLAGKRLSPRWRHALWWIVALRLAIPSLPTLPYAPVDWHAAEQVVDTRLAAWTPDALPFSVEPLNTIAPEVDVVGEVSAVPAASEPSLESVEWFYPAESFAADPAPAEPWLQRALFGLWALGVIWSATALITCELRFRRRLSQAQPNRDPLLQEELRQEARRCGLLHAPRAYLLDGLPSPAVMGLRRGRLLLPKNFGADLSPSARRSILRHELFHLRHRDPWQELGLRLLETLFWFHPLVHFAFSKLRNERESLRDWEALNVDRGLAPSQYAHTLLDLVARPARDVNDPLAPTSSGSIAPESLPLATGFLENAQDLPRRMQMITSFRPANLRDLGLGGLALAGTAWLALASAHTPEAPALDTELATGDQVERTQLRVARIDLVPAWKQELYHLLEASTEGVVHWTRVSGTELSQLLSEALALPTLTDPNDIDLDEVELDYSSRPGQSKREFLNGLCSSSNLQLNWSVNFGAILIGTADFVPQDIGHFILDASPLEDEDFYIDDLESMIPEYSTGWEPWEREGTEFFHMGSAQFMMRNTPEQVELVKSFCEDLLARHSPSFDVARSARRVHLDALETQLPNGYSEGDPSSDVIRSIADECGVPIRVSVDLMDLDQDVSAQVSPMHVLAWMAHVNQARIEVDELGVWIGDSDSENHPLWTNVYASWELHDYFAPDDLTNMVYQASNVDELEGASIGGMEGLIFLRTSPSSHEAVIAMLQGLENHLGD